MYYLKILFIVSSLFIFDFSLAGAVDASSLPEKVKSILDSVWKVAAVDKNFQGYPKGTGFFISPNQFVTNFHVVEAILKQDKFNMLLVVNRNNNKSFKIKNIQKLSAIHDLAILEIDGEVTNYLSLQISPRAMIITEDLFFVGYPQGILRMQESRRQGGATKQGVYFVNSNSYYGFFLDYSGELGGASGSPVLNEEGEVVGVMSRVYTDVYNAIETVYAIKTKPLQNLLQEKTEFFSNSYEDIKKEEIKLKKMAEQGHALAQKEVGYNLYYDDWPSKNDKNVEKAFYWFKKAAEQGDPFSMLKLHSMYSHGIGTAKDLEKADYWLKKKWEQSLNYHAIQELGLGEIVQFFKSIGF